MPTWLPLPLLLLLTLAWGGAPACADEEAVALPFRHRVTERWGLRLEREERRDADAAHLQTSEAEAQVLSPYGRDLLVEVRWLRVSEAGGTLTLLPRRPETAQALDLLGGGLWRMRVDGRGTALALLNADEVRTALARARGAALDDAAWAAAESDLLADWNVVYGACGVPLVPSAERVTPLHAEGAGEDRPTAGQDVRVLVLERSPETAGAARVTALSVNARTHLREAGERGATLQRTSSTRYDLTSGRLSGWQLSVRVDAQRRVVERLAFAELPLAPVAGHAPLAQRERSSGSMP